MKKYGLRILVGLLAFGMGCALSLIWELNQNNVCHYVAQDNSKPEFSDLNYSNPNGKIEVRFIGFGRIEKRPTLKFEIKNNFLFPVKYRAGEEGKPDILLKFNGKEIDKVTGLICIYERDFTLGEKESLKLEVIADKLIYKQLKEKGQFEFGFAYHLFNNSEQNIYNFANYDRKVWTEPIVISEELKKKILKNFPDFYYQNEEELNKEKLQIFSPKQLKNFER